MGAVNSRDEVFLYGVHYRVTRPVQPQLVPAFPPRSVVGDPGRSDQVIASEWIMADWRGGMGVREMDEKTQDDRFWTGSALSMFKKQLTLPLQAKATGKGALTGSPVVYAGAELGSDLYLAFDTTVQKYNNTTGVWAAARTLAGTPFDALVYNNKLYFFTGTEYDYSSDGTTWSRVSVPGRYATIFDNRLVTLDNNGQLRYTFDGINWLQNAKLPLQSGNYLSLKTYWNQAGEPALYVGTKFGVYVVDFFSQQVYETVLQFAPSDYGGRMLAWKDGYMYVADGLAVHRFNGSTTSPVGLDRDDGVPSDLKGTIVAFARSPNWLVAIVDATSVQATTTDFLYSGQEWGSEVMNRSVGYSALLAWTGVGWHTLHRSSKLNTGTRFALLSTVHSELRLWFGVDGQAKYIVVPEGVYDPIEDASALYELSGDLTTAWFDAGFSEIAKVATRLRLRGLNLSDVAAGDPRIDVYYATDDSDAWTLLTQMVADVPSEITFNGGLGTEFSKIRFKFELHSSVASTTPVLLFASLRYLKIPTITWGWTFEVDCTQPYRGRSTDELLRSIRKAGECKYPDATAKSLGEFTFRDGTDSEQTYYVRVSGEAGREYTGDVERGKFQVTVVAP